MTECDWCGDDIPHPRRHYCSSGCESAALEHAAKGVAALRNGEEPPSRPDATRGDPEVERWTLPKMRARVATLQRRASR